MSPLIAVALSGGVDSSAAAILLHEQGQRLMGLTLALDESTPAAHQVEMAKLLCRRLGITHRVLSVDREFREIKEYFCRQYLAGRTPNPCVLCNRDIKFGYLLTRAMSLGADQIATGHYVRSADHEGRRYVARAKETKSQEYFLGLVGQQALARSVFPLGDMTREEAQKLVASAGLDIPITQSSQDVCFIGPGGYVPFIMSYTGYRPESGAILDIRGRILGCHQGALRYTVGQRKGLGIGLGRRVYVLAVDPVKNTVTVGDISAWKHRGFFVPALNFMKIDRLGDPLAVDVKVRYRQEAKPAVLHPERGSGAWVEFEGLYAPGQLAVFYDSDGEVLCAGIIERPEERERGLQGMKGRRGA